MKKEILMLIIGILIGAIIATGVFLVLQSNNSSTNGVGGGDMSQMDGEAPDDMGNRVEGGAPSTDDTNTSTDTNTESDS